MISTHVLNPLGVHSPRLAANSSYRRKPVSRGPDWIPPPVRGRHVKHGMTDQNRRRCSAAYCGVVHSVVNRPRFTLKVLPGTGEHFEVSSEDQPTLTACLLRRARQRAGLSLAQVAERLGATSINAYAPYEQGRSVPTIQKLSELFAAVMPHRDLVLVESET